jgi:hypothetical protein
VGTILSHFIFVLSVTDKMEGNRSSRRDDASDDKDSDTNDRKMSSEFEDKVV